MKTLYTILLAVTALLLIGCGTDNSNNLNQEEDSIEERFNYFQQGVLLTGDSTCHQNLLYGDSYVIHTYIYHNDAFNGNISFDIERFRKLDCTEPVGWSSSSYDFVLDSNATTGNTLGVQIINTSYNYDEKNFEIEKMLSGMVFGTTVLNNIYYTTIVGAGDVRKEQLQIGFAHPTTINDGTSPDKRAIDTSVYIQKTYYIKEAKDY